MKTLTAAALASDDIWSFGADDSLMIAAPCQPPVMVFHAALGRRLVLVAYVRGELSRPVAMRLLGMTWYGDLLDALAQENLEKPSLPAADRERMRINALAAFGAP